MRVVMLVGRSTGGIGVHATDLASQLRSLGTDVEVVTDPLTAQRFGLVDARLWWPGRAVGVGASVRGLVRLRRLAGRADIVHAHGHQAGLLAAVVLLGLRTPLVVSQHNAVLTASGVARWVSALSQRLVGRRARLVTGASRDLVEEARRHGARQARLAPVPSPRVQALLSTDPPGDAQRRAFAADLLRANGIDFPPDTPMVLTIARIAPQKGLDTLVDAAAASVSAHMHEVVTAENGPVWIVVGGGDDPLRDALVERAAAVGAPLHLVGPQDDPEPWLRAADVFVLTSRWEARALVVQEAMAAGVPVVATDTGGLRDLVDGVGTLVPVGDAAATAAAVGAYLADPVVRHTASVEGRELARSWDDGPATARRWQQWYSALASMT